MSRFGSRDYFWLADRLREDLAEADRMLSSDARVQAINSIYRWTKALAADNPKTFNKSQFIINCGLASYGDRREPRSISNHQDHSAKNDFLECDKCSSPSYCGKSGRCLVFSSSSSTSIKAN